MNIACYHATLPGARTGKEGGVNYVVHRLCNAFVAAGHHLTLFSFDPAPADALYTPRRLPLARWCQPLPGRLTMTPLLLSCLDLRGFDVMHSHGDDHFVFRRPLPWVRTLHGSAKRELQSAMRLRRRLSQAALIPLEGLAARLADVAVAVSGDTAACFPGVTEVIPNGVDLGLFRPGPCPPSAVPSILFVGALEGRKRGRLLLDIFQRCIRPAFPAAELWMVCEPGRGEVAEGVIWHGKVSTERLVELYQQAWVFCLPSTYEGFGVPYIEALACGTPIVASRNPGAREVLDGGRYGLLADDEHLPAVLRALLGNAEHRRHLSTQGLQRARAYEWSHIAARYADVYEQAQGAALTLRRGYGPSPVESS